MALANDILTRKGQTRWKVLWESTIPRESNRRVYWPLCYITLRYHSRIWFSVPV